MGVPRIQKHSLTEPQPFSFATDKRLVERTVQQEESSGKVAKKAGEAPAAVNPHADLFDDSVRKSSFFCLIEIEKKKLSSPRRSNSRYSRSPRLQSRNRSICSRSNEAPTIRATRRSSKRRRSRTSGTTNPSFRVTNHDDRQRAEAFRARPADALYKAPFETVKSNKPLTTIDPNVMLHSDFRSK